jgi:hypothetical protein
VLQAGEGKGDCKVGYKLIAEGMMEERKLMKLTLTGACCLRDGYQANRSTRIVTMPRTWNLVSRMLMLLTSARWTHLFQWQLEQRLRVPIFQRVDGKQILSIAGACLEEPGMTSVV